MYEFFQLFNIIYIYKAMISIDKFLLKSNERGKKN